MHMSAKNEVRNEHAQQEEKINLSNTLSKKKEISSMKKQRIVKE